MLTVRSLSEVQHVNTYVMKAAAEAVAGTVVNMLKAGMEFIYIQYTVTYYQG